MRRADFSRAEPQSAPQNATSVSGTPQSITAERKGNGGKLAGKSASTKQPMAMANINKQHFLLAGS